jgi:hypothetical protein
MTREEAVEILNNLDDGKLTHGMASKWVNRLSALGILKLDERKTPEEEIRTALNSIDDEFGLDADDVFHAIRSSSLKVVRA